MANWLHHGIITKKQLDETMKKMALIVDKQNKDDKNYTSMGPSFDTTAFKAACDLVYKGKELPSGYTEPVLHERRIELKSQ